MICRSVRYLSDRVIVMYLGHIVEQGRTEDVFAPPYHPYTEALLSAVPIADTSVRRKRIVLKGEIPSAINPPPGCPFQTRCRWKHRVPGMRCDTEMPPMVELTTGHFIKCHLAPQCWRKWSPSSRSQRHTTRSSTPPPGPTSQVSPLNRLRAIFENHLTYSGQRY